MTVWIYIDTSKQVGDADHVKAFATRDAAQAWLDEHDPKGVAFEYPVIGGKDGGGMIPPPVAPHAMRKVEERLWLGLN